MWGLWRRVEGSGFRAWGAGECSGFGVDSKVIGE